MAMADLAANTSAHGDAGPVTLAEIAARQSISHSYLEQLFSRLRRAGVVESVRGPGGGYRLARPADETRVADIIVAVDEPITATRCAAREGAGCTGRNERCITHDLWDELGRQIYLFLSGVTLADIVDKRVLGRSQSPVHAGVFGLTGVNVDTGGPARAGSD